MALDKVGKTKDNYLTQVTATFSKSSPVHASFVTLQFFSSKSSSKPISHDWLNHFPVKWNLLSDVNMLQWLV